MPTRKVNLLYIVGTDTDLKLGARSPAQNAVKKFQGALQFCVVPLQLRGYNTKLGAV